MQHSLITDLRANVLRTDPRAPAADADFPAWAAGDRQTLALALATAVQEETVWHQTLAIHDAALAACHSTWLPEADPRTLVEFVRAGATLEVQHLRRNSLVACHQAARLNALADDVSPLLSLVLPPVRPISSRPSRAPGREGALARVQQTPATYDEALVVRLSATLGRSSEPTRTQAAVAIATSAVSVGEGAAVTWGSRATLTTADGEVSALTVTGRHVGDDIAHGRHLAPRTVPLDGWSARAIDAWAVRAAEIGHLNPRDSMIYGGRADVASHRAAMGYVKAVEVARVAAGLVGQPGATPGGLQLWAVAHAVLTDGVDAGAAIHGTDAANTLRKLLNTTDRAYRFPAAGEATGRAHDTRSITVSRTKD